MNSSRAHLADLFDFEVQVLREDNPPSPTTLARDEAIGQRMPTDRRSSWSQLAFWLEEVKHATDRTWPGKSILEIYRYTAAGMFTLGIVTGIGTTRTVLHTNSRPPIDIFHWLGLFFLLPLLLTLITLSTLIVSKLRSSRRDPFAPWYGPLGALVTQKLVAWLMQRYQKTEFSTLIHRFHVLHTALLRAKVFQLLQVFGIAFYSSTLAYLLYRARLTDMAFSWGTTMTEDPSTMSRIIELIALPFSWLIASPTQELIAASRYTNFANTYATANGAEISKQWWVFLAAVTATYGVMPRLILLFAGQLSIARYLQNLRWDDHVSTALLRRLAWARTQKILSGAKGFNTKDPGSQDELSGAGLPRIPCLIIKWRNVDISEGFIAANVTTPYHLSANYIYEAIGTAAERKWLVETLTQPIAPRTVVILIDPWEFPGHALSKISAAMRTSSSYPLTILYAPVSENPKYRLYQQEELTMWQAAIKELDDCYTGLLTDYGAMP